MQVRDLEKLPESEGGASNVAAVFSRTGGTVLQVTVRPGQAWSDLGRVVSGRISLMVWRGTGAIQVDEALTASLQPGRIVLIESPVGAIVSASGTDPLVLLVHVLGSNGVTAPTTPADGTVTPSGAGAKPPTPADSDSAPPETQTLQATSLGAVERVHILDGILLATQPSADDFAHAKEAGVRTVVSMRHPGEHPELDEATLVKGLGMRFVNVPWNGEAELTDAIIDQHRAILRTAARPMLVHCSTGNRVGAIWYAFRVLDGGIEPAQAMSEAKRVGLASPAFEEKVRRYVEERSGVISDGIAESPGSLTPETYHHILEALQAERRAITFELAAIERFGAQGVFGTVVDVERTREHRLEAILRARGATVPQRAPRDVPGVPMTLQEACREALSLQWRLVRVYQRVMPSITDDEVYATMATLLAAARDKALPAYQACADGK